MIYDKDIDGDEPVIISGIYYQPPGERLLCDSCGVVSNNHKVSDPFWYKNKNWPDFFNPQLVCVHTCVRCGRNDGDLSTSFTDAGNYDSDDTRDIQKWEEELSELVLEVELLTDKIQKGKARWAELWETKEDAS